MPTRRSAARPPARARAIPRSRQQTMEATREALIAAGVAAMGAEGLDASLDGICARAGFTRGAFYVHFRDRDDFLQAVMERVGAVFLAKMFGGAAPTAQGGRLASTVRRFVGAVGSGAYPLAPKGGVRPHQLLEACARSPVIRARYVALIDACLQQLRDEVRADQRTAALRDDVEPAELALLLMAGVVGAQTLLELGVPLDVGALAAALLTLFAPAPRPRARRR